MIKRNLFLRSHLLVGLVGVLAVMGCEKKVEQTSSIASASSLAVEASSAAASSAPSVTQNEPLDKAVVESDDKNPCFSWSAPAVAGFEFYNVVVSTTPNFPESKWVHRVTNESETLVCWNNGAGWEPKGTNPPAVASKLKPSVTYYWRVASSYAGQATLTDVRAFTVTGPTPTVSAEGTPTK